MKNTKRILLAAVAALLLVAVSVGGTLAWLTATTDSVTNTFTASNIAIKLDETTNNYKMVPGLTIAKDPKVTVNDGSEDCWLFVKVEKSENFDTFMTYAMADGWNLVEGTTNVYARKVLATDTIKSFSVLKDDQVTVKTSVTKDMMNPTDGTEFSKPTLTFTAYATQLYKNNTTMFTAAEAWTAYSNPTDTPAGT